MSAEQKWALNLLEVIKAKNELKEEQEEEVAHECWLWNYSYRKNQPTLLHVETN